MMHRLINRTPNGIATLLNIFSTHIKNEGLTAMRQNAEIILVVCFIICVYILCILKLNILG